MADRNRNRFNISAMTDEQLMEFMDSVETDEENDFSRDDEDKDPNYMPDEISPEEEHCISQCIRDMDNSDMFIARAIDMSLNISALDAPSGSSTLVGITETENVENIQVEETVTTSAPEEPVASTSAKKPAKRARSPLPMVESSGPTNVPSAGGFIGEGKNCK